MLKLLSSAAHHTEALGFEIGRRLTAGTTIALYGDLGAGKTVLVKGLARGLGITETITSPTFIIVAPYRGRRELVHADAYRLEGANANQLLQVGLLESFGSDVVCAVEWAEHVERYLPAERLEVRLVYHDEGRAVTVTPHGERCAALVEELKTVGLADN